MAAGEHPPAWSRLIRRLFTPFLSHEDKKRIADAIAELENKTTGEVHVHVVGRAGADPLALAQKTFHRLGLEKTAHRNGVLILVSHLDHKFAIYGDEGIHSKSGQHLWDKAAAALRERFAARRYPEGIESCVREIGKELARHFPRNNAGPGPTHASHGVTES